MRILSSTLTYPCSKIARGFIDYIDYHGRRSFSTQLHAKAISKTLESSVFIYEGDWNRDKKKSRVSLNVYKIILCV